MKLDLTGKNALVCGGSQGIGRAVAIELAALGANVTMVARNVKNLTKLRKELSLKSGQHHDFIQADFTFPAELKNKVETYIEEKHGFHILINNMGGPPSGEAHSAKKVEFTQAFSNHLICNHILMQAVVEFMQKEKYGRIINIISTSVKQPIKGLGVSNTIRAAVASWAKTLSFELAPHGITVNNVLPGATKTERLTAIIDAKHLKTKQSKEEIEKEMLHEIPAGRFAEPNEIANAVVFLASPAAGYINGINVPVDGGRTQCL